MLSLFFNQSCHNELNSTDYHSHTSSRLRNECVKTFYSRVYTIALPNDFWVIPKCDMIGRLEGKPRLGPSTGSTSNKVCSLLICFGISCWYYMLYITIIETIV